MLHIQKKQNMAGSQTARMTSRQYLLLTYVCFTRNSDSWELHLLGISLAVSSNCSLTQLRNHQLLIFTVTRSIHHNHPFHHPNHPSISRLFSSKTNQAYGRLLPKSRQVVTQLVLGTILGSARTTLVFSDVFQRFRKSRDSYHGSNLGCYSGGHTSGSKLDRLISPPSSGPALSSSSIQL